MKISEIKELIELVNATDIHELELENESSKLILRKGGALVQTVQYQPQPVVTQPTPAPQAVAPATVPPATPTLEIAQDAPVQVSGKPVIAPMVGTFYRASRPGADPFVKVGDRVKAGQSLCIIEAMKLMNEIEAEFSGKVVDILVEDGQPVEYGQNLFIIDPEK